MAVVAKESGRSIVAAIRYLIFSCLGSGLVLLGISILYSVTGHLLMESLGAEIARMVEQGIYVGPLTASALLMTLGAKSLFQQAAILIGGERASVLSTLEPITSIVVGVAVFHERVGLNTLAGAALVISASVFIALSDMKKAKEALRS